MYMYVQGNHQISLANGLYRGQCTKSNCINTPSCIYIYTYIYIYIYIYICVCVYVCVYVCVCVCFGDQRMCYGSVIGIYDGHPAQKK